MKISHTRIPVSPSANSLPSQPEVPKVVLNEEVQWLPAHPNYDYKSALENMTKLLHPFGKWRFLRRTLSLLRYDTSPIVSKAVRLRAGRQGYTLNTHISYYQLHYFGRSWHFRLSSRGGFVKIHPDCILSVRHCPLLTSSHLWICLSSQITSPKLFYQITWPDLTYDIFSDNLTWPMLFSQITWPDLCYFLR